MSLIEIWVGDTKPWEGEKIKDGPHKLSKETALGEVSRKLSAERTS